METDINTVWFERAKNIQNTDELKTFIDEIIEYEHNYDSIVCACAAGAIASINAINNSESGNITGYQAHMIMSKFLFKFYYYNNKCGLGLKNYDDMLYPQYEHKFDKVIDTYTWESIKKAAQEKLDNIVINKPPREDVKAHWESIVSGTIPFGFVVKMEENES
jgi:hypothetical protein